MLDIKAHGLNFRITFQQLKAQNFNTRLHKLKEFKIFRREIL